MTKFLASYFLGALCIRNTTSFNYAEKLSMNKSFNHDIGWLGS